MVLPTLAHLRWLARFGDDRGGDSIDDRRQSVRARPDPVTPKVAADGSLVPVDIPW